MTIFEFFYKNSNNDFRQNHILVMNLIVTHIYDLRKNTKLELKSLGLRK